MCGCRQDCWGDGGVPASGNKRGEGIERDQGGAPPDEDGHQGSGGQSGYGERGEEPIALPVEPCSVWFTIELMNGSLSYRFGPAPS